MLRSLVGSEMCIRDSSGRAPQVPRTAHSLCWSKTIIERCSRRLMLNLSVQCARRLRVPVAVSISSFRILLQTAYYRKTGHKGREKRGARRFSRWHLKQRAEREKREALGPRRFSRWYLLDNIRRDASFNSVQGSRQAKKALPSTYRKITIFVVVVASYL